LSGRLALPRNSVKTPFAPGRALSVKAALCAALAAREAGADVIVRGLTAGVVFGRLAGTSAAAG
jgi:hypothetical protein